MRHSGLLTIWTLHLLCVSLLAACAGQETPDRPTHLRPELVSVQTLQRCPDQTG